MINELTQKRLKELLAYDPGTGMFTWRIGRTGTARAGSVAGSLDADGYPQIKVDNRLYKAHRLAWLYVHGEFPLHQIDHINRVRTDNRIENLRPATNSENHQNRCKHRNNTSGVVGVFWHKKYGKWQAQIQVSGRKIDLGLHETIEAATAARASAKAKLHTFHSEDVA